MEKTNIENLISTNPTAHHVVLDYLRVLWKGGSVNDEFEKKSLNKDLGFNTINLAELILSVVKERNLSKERVMDFINFDPKLYMLIKRIDILSNDFTEMQRIVLLDTGVVADRREVCSITDNFDEVSFIIKFIKAIEGTKSLTGHSAVDAEFIIVENENIRIAKKIWPPQDEEYTKELIRIFVKGPEYWNEWRKQNPNKIIDLRNVNFSSYEYNLTRSNNVSFKGINMKGANLENAAFPMYDLEKSDFSEAYMKKIIFQRTGLEGCQFTGSYMPESDLMMAKMNNTDLRGVELSSSSLYSSCFSGADLRGANLNNCSAQDSDFSNAILRNASLENINLRDSDLSFCDFSYSNLSGAILVNSNFCKAKLDESRVYGASVWKINLDGCSQENLIVTSQGEPELTVDNLNMAQFLYLIMDNPKLRGVIDSITSKAVLILGRFSKDRKPLLDLIKQELKRKGYLPIIYDFDGPKSRNFQETISTIAHLSRFVIADLSDPKSVPQELMGIVPSLPSLPIQPIIAKGEEPWSMFSHIQNFPWVLDILEYQSELDIIAALNNGLLEKIESIIKK